MSMYLYTIGKRPLHFSSSLISFSHFLVHLYNQTLGGCCSLSAVNYYSQCFNNNLNISVNMVNMLSSYFLHFSILIFSFLFLCQIIQNDFAVSLYRYCHNTCKVNIYMHCLVIRICLFLDSDWIHWNKLYTLTPSSSFNLTEDFDKYSLQIKGL